MGPLRSVAPFALGAALLVAATAGLVVLTIRDIPLAERTSAVAPARSGVSVRGSELSRTGRLAWWRAAPEGGAQLWVANVDGTLRRAIARIDDLRRISKVRWTPDGNAVAYLDLGSTLVLVRLDGGRSETRLADGLLAEGRRLVDQRWSKSGTKVAATVQRTGDGRSDVWIAKAGDDSWVRATQLEDAIAGEWLDDDELLVSTTGGLLGVLRDGPPNAVRPITGLAAGSPFVGEDGRVWFLAGRVSPGSIDADPMILVSDAALWSAYVDGSDPRQEQRITGQDALRLDGRWPDGRLLVHRGSAPGQALFGEGVVTSLSGGAGLIERVSIAQDKKSALAFTSSRVVRLDLSKPGTIGSTVLLDAVSNADAWFPATVRAARPQPVPAATRPAARYVLAHAGSLWSMDASGAISLLRAGSAIVNAPRRGPLPLPAWSPAGELLLTTEPAPGPQAQLALQAVTIDRGGRVTRLGGLGPVTRAGAVWSPDGRTVAAVGAPGGTPVGQPGAADDLEVRFATLDGSTPRASVPGREVAWSRSGLYVLGNGTFEPSTRVRAGQAIEIVDGTARRPLVTIAALLADPRAQLPSSGVIAQGGAQLAASPDGSYLSVGVSHATATQNRFFLVLVRVADGRATFVAADQASDFAWSPARPIVAYTSLEPSRGAATPQGPSAPTARTSVATLVDAASGEVLGRVEGRFAGWAPDGTGFHVARDTGLYYFASPRADALRIGPVGVPVAATTS